jgi:hypothetical protein
MPLAGDPDAPTRGMARLSRPHPRRVERLLQRGRDGADDRRRWRRRPLALQRCSRQVAYEAQSWLADLAALRSSRTI